MSEAVDLSLTIEPNSEQVNAEDLLAHPVEVTITGVEKGNTEQPVFIHLAEFPTRTFRPGKTMRRLLVAVWGPDSRTYAGRRMRLYNDPDVKFGGKSVGGVRISHMSHIDMPVTVQLMVTRGKRAPFTVQPLALAVTVEDAGGWLLEAETLPELQAAWGRVQQAGLAGDQELVELKNERKAELGG